MEEKKVKAGSVAVGICLFVIAILLVIIVLFCYSTNTEKSKLEVKVSELEGIITEKEEKVNQLEKKILNVSDVVNGEDIEISNDSNNELKIPSVYTSDTKNLIKEVNYDLAAEDGYYFISTRNNKITFTFSKDEEELKKLADFLNIKENDIKVKANKSIEVEGFSKKVADIEIGCIGQDYTQAIFIFLMEDGTIEYSDVENMLTNASSQGKIDNLKNIVRVQNVDVWAPEDSGHVSIIAIDKDNICYDISNYIDS